MSADRENGISTAKRFLFLNYICGSHAVYVFAAQRLQFDQFAVSPLSKYIEGFLREGYLLYVFAG